MKFLFPVLLCIFSFSLKGQILRPGEQPVEEKKTTEEQKEKTVVIDGVEYELKEKKQRNRGRDTTETDTLRFKNQLFYANLIPSHVFRVYEPGKYVTTREDESPGFKLSYTLGLRTKLGKLLIMDVAFAYYVNGENYLFEAKDSDSTFFMTRNHNYLSIPLKLGLQFELEEVRLFIQSGMAPSMLFNQVENSTINSSNNQLTTERVVNKNNLNQFNFTFLGALGAHYKFSDALGAQIMTEFRYNLLPSDINQSFTHKAWGVGFHVGFTYGM